MQTEFKESALPPHLPSPLSIQHIITEKGMQQVFSGIQKINQLTGRRTYNIVWERLSL